MAVDHTQIIEAVKEALARKANFKEPTCADIKALIPDFIEAGLSGELTGKSWSPRYGVMNEYYIKKYLDEAFVLGFGPNPLLPKAIRKTLNANKRSVTEKRNRYASAIAYTNFLVLQGKLPKSRMQEIRTLRPQRNSPVKKRFITREEIDRIKSQTWNCKFTNNYDKELLITVIEIAEETGLRIGEISAIKISDLNLKERELYIPRAKGGSDFTKGLTVRAVTVIETYLAIRPKTESLSLFVLDNGKPLSRDTLIQRFRRVTKKLGLDTSFHAFRRRYISRHLQDGKSLIDVSLAVNHKSPRMTEQYLIPDVRRSIEEQKKW